MFLAGNNIEGYDAGQVKLSHFMDLYNDKSKFLYIKTIRKENKSLILRRKDIILKN